MKGKSEVLVAGVAVSVLFLLLAVVGFRGTFAAKPVSADVTKIVETISCNLAGLPQQLSGTFGSAGAPVVTDTDCAQGVSDLTKKSFTLDFVTASNENNVTFTLNSPASVRPWKRSQPMDVEIVGCNPPFINGVSLTTDNSEDAPYITPSTSCTQDLADLTNVGFTISFVEPLEAFGDTYYRNIFVLQRPR